MKQCQPNSLVAFTELPIGDEHLRIVHRAGTHFEWEPSEPAEIYNLQQSSITAAHHKPT